MRVTNYSVPDEEVEALIFDVDGTLVDTMPFHHEAWAKITKEFGIKFSEEKFYTFAGRPSRDILRDLYFETFNKYPTDEFFKEFKEKKNGYFEEIEKKKGHPKAIECVVKFAKEFKAKGKKIAAASSGSRSNVMKSLTENGLLGELFEEKFVVVAADLPPGRGKPEPDIFLEAAKRLGVNPTKCRVFEDGESGFVAGFKAGMEVLDVREFEGYPIAPALKALLPEMKANRTWLK